MPVENGDDRNAALEDNEIDQIGKTMHDCHSNVIEQDREPEWLLLDRGLGRGDFVCVLAAESSAECLIPGERFRDIDCRRLPNEQTRHYAPGALSS